MMTWLIVALLVVAVLVAAPFMADALRKEPDYDAAPGAFADLSQGVTHYRWYGPVRGPVVVAVHGLTTPSETFDAVAKKLGALGYRVLTYDIFGRGYSANVRGKQDRRFLLRQLDDLLADQGLDDDLTILGFSMGGMVATVFAAENPHRVKRLILLASGGVRADLGRAAGVVRPQAIFGRWLYHIFGARSLHKHIDGNISEASEVPDIYEVQLAQLRRKGFRDASYDSIRGLIGEDLEPDHRKLAREGVPVVAIWADQDTIIPMSALGVMSQWNRDARQDVVAGAGHGVPYTHASKVSELLAGILRE